MWFFLSRAWPQFQTALQVPAQVDRSGPCSVSEAIVPKRRLRPRMRLRRKRHLRRSGPPKRSRHGSTPGVVHFAPGVWRTAPGEVISTMVRHAATLQAQAAPVQPPPPEPPAQPTPAQPPPVDGTATTVAPPPTPYVYPAPPAAPVETYVYPGYPAPVPYGSVSVGVGVGVWPAPAYRYYYGGRWWLPLPCSPLQLRSWRAVPRGPLNRLSARRRHCLRRRLD